MTRLPTRALASLFALALPLCTLPALAERTTIKEYKFDAGNLHEIDLRGAVGSINVIHTDTDKVSVVLEIKQHSHHWWKKDIDLDSVELHDRVRGDRLTLEQTDEDLNIDWTVEVPAMEKVSIKVGVGAIDAELGNTEVYANIGVGEVKLSMPEKYAGEIRLDTGVGDANLRGGERDNSRKHSSFVSQKVSGHGKGDKDVTVKVGVGDIRVRLEDSKS